MERSAKWTLFTDCIIVNGKVRSIIVDLTRKSYCFIPEDLRKILEREHNSFESLVSEYGKENYDTIESYFNFLIENEIIMPYDDDVKTKFPPISKNWEYPALITNAIIDYNEDSTFSFDKLLNELERLNCQDIQIRSFSELDIDAWNELLAYTNYLRIRSISILAKWNPSVGVDGYADLIKANPRISSFVLFTPENDTVENVIKIIKQTESLPIFIISEKIKDSLNCGLVHWNYFNVNITLFTEAQQHNTCLNRKISIDVNGEIKNCPSMAKSYGNIKDTTLAEAIEKTGFKDLWFINKDKIHVCKDCEFRYICTDCRAYIENPEDIYSKPLKCGYNPYTAEWEEWSNNPLKQKAIEYYGMQELVKKEK